MPCSGSGASRTGRPRRRDIRLCHACAGDGKAFPARWSAPVRGHPVVRRRTTATAGRLMLPSGVSRHAAPSAPPRAGRAHRNTLLRSSGADSLLPSVPRVTSKDGVTLPADRTARTRRTRMSNGLGRMARIGVFAASIAMVVACGSNGDPDEGDESPSPMSPSPTSPSPWEIPSPSSGSPSHGGGESVPPPPPPPTNTGPSKEKGPDIAPPSDAPTPDCPGAPGCSPPPGESLPPEVPPPDAT